MNEQETIVDIIAEKRREADYIEETARGSLKAGENYDGIAYTESDLESALDLVESKRKEADRLEAAHRREIDVLKQRRTELNAEVAAKDEVIKRLNDAIAEEQRRKMATAENPSAVGDCAKLREAVKAVVDVGYPHNFQKEAPHIRGYCYDITRAIEKCFAALAAPPRNCDVGTAEEQYSRMFWECYEWVCMDCKQNKDLRKCALSWAQKPYKKGSAE